MASGEMSPVSKTLPPRRVTSRSSARVLSRCACTRAIFNLQELEPMSIAAKVGMNYFGALRKKNRPIAKIHEGGVWLGPWVPQAATRQNRRPAVSDLYYA